MGIFDSIGSAVKPVTSFGGNLLGGGIKGAVGFAGETLRGFLGGLGLDPSMLFIILGIGLAIFLLK